MVRRINEGIDINLKRLQGGFNPWYQDTVYYNGDKFVITAAVFEDPSKYGIKNGRISKLDIVQKDKDGNKIDSCSYDRGWVGKPKGDIKVVFDALIDQYN